MEQLQFVPPHQKKSREVTQADVPRVLEEIERMRGAFKQKNCLALAHPQVDDKDPLRFFITYDGHVFINPVIGRHSGYTVDSTEGCMTFPGFPYIVKQRWQKVDITYQIIRDGILSVPREKALSGLPSKIAQHEVDHLDAIYCYQPGPQGNALAKQT